MATTEFARFTHVELDRQIIAELDPIRTQAELDPIRTQAELDPIRTQAELLTIRDGLGSLT